MQIPTPRPAGRGPRCCIGNRLLGPPGGNPGLGGSPGRADSGSRICAGPWKKQRGPRSRQAPGACECPVWPHSELPSACGRPGLPPWAAREPPTPRARSRPGPHRIIIGVEAASRGNDGVGAKCPLPQARPRAVRVCDVCVCDVCVRDVCACEFMCAVCMCKCMCMWMCARGCVSVHACGCVCTCATCVHMCLCV